MSRYAVQYERNAELDLEFLGRKAEALVRVAVRRYLADQPLPVPGQQGQRKALNANPLGAQFRLQVGVYRAYYNVEGDEVQVLRVGYKPRETLYLRGVAFPMRD